MKKQRVVHVVQHLKPGGLESLVLDIVRFSHTNTLVISLEGTKDDAFKHWPKLTQYHDLISFLNKKRGVQYSLLSSLYKLFKALKPDVVHTHHIGPLLYAGIAAKIAGVPHRIHTEHDAWHLCNPKHRALESAALKLITPHIVADAEGIGLQLQQFFPNQQIRTIVNGIDTQRFVPGDKSAQRKRLNLPLSVLLIGSAGRLEIVKGHDLLISALALLPTNVHLTIAGSGSQRASLEEQVNTLKLTNRVHFVGHVENVEHFYQALDLFCLPSRNEGYPLTALEAQACGIRTAATNVGCARETLCPNSGVLLAPNNVRSMASSLKRMLSEPEQRGIDPRAFVCVQNDIRQMISAYERITHPQPTVFA